MKIGLLVAQYLAENTGSWRVVKSILQRLDPDTFRLVLLLPEPGDISKAIPSHVRVRYVSVPRLRARLGPTDQLRTLARGIAAAAQVRRIILEESIDVVHCHGLPNLFPAVAAAVSRTPLVWHVHELEFSPRPVFGALVWLCGRLADRIVCVSEAVMRLFAGSRKAMVIHNGIDLERFEADPVRRSEGRRRLALDDDAFVVAQLGRIVPVKGVEWFIALAEAFVAASGAAGSAARFAVIGGPIAGHEGYFEAIRDRMRTSPARDRLIYLPAVDDPRDILAAVDVLVQSSVIAESFGLTLVEAMAMGAPVITSEHGGPAEIIRDGVDGFLVSPRDVERRAAILAGLFADHAQLVRMGASGRARARAVFSADRMADELAVLYRTLVAAPVAQPVGAARG